MKSFWLIQLMVAAAALSVGAQDTQVVLSFGDPADAEKIAAFCEEQPQVCELMSFTNDPIVIYADTLNRLAIDAVASANGNNPTKDATANATPVTPATSIHGTPGNNPGNGGSSASPGGNGVNGGNGIHNIAGGSPGWNGTPTSQTEDGRQPACDMHGGLGDQYGNANCAATD